ncbi:hypothetical protein V5O48_019697, partial [Marasmius crinis-equi]
PGDTIAEVVMRGQNAPANPPTRTSPKSMLLTIPQAVKNFYVKQTEAEEEAHEETEMNYWESEEEDSDGGEEETGFEADTEDEEDDELSEYTTDEYEELEVDMVLNNRVNLGAERSTASSRDARQKQQAGPSEEARDQ